MIPQNEQNVNMQIHLQKVHMYRTVNILLQIHLLNVLSFVCEMLEYTSSPGGCKHARKIYKDNIKNHLIIKVLAD